jgi:hypothetical protein
MHSQLAHNIGAVRFCGLNTDPEPDRYFFAALTLRQKLNNFPLAPGKSLIDRDRRRCFWILIAMPCY